jgi:hypothetical protein
MTPIRSTRLKAGNAQVEIDLRGYGIELLTFSPEGNLDY